jgi:uncharacterized protein (TIGR00297 family)
LLVALIAALAELAADTASSEIGQAWGGTPRLVTNWSEVPSGTDGAITAIGMLAGVVSAFLIGWTGALSGVVPQRSWMLCGGAAIAGTLADSFLGATLERRKKLDNNSVNFLSTLIAAAVASVFS